MAVKLYRPGIKIPVKIGEVTFFLTPLRGWQKLELAALQVQNSGQTTENIGKATYLGIKYSLKDIKGVECAESGKPYELAFTEDRDDKDRPVSLTETCVDEVLSLEMGQDLVIACFQFLNGIPKKIVHPETGQEIKHIKILPIDSKMTKKK